MYFGPLVTDIAPGYDHITSAIDGKESLLHPVQAFLLCNTCRAFASAEC